MQAGIVYQNKPFTKTALSVLILAGACCSIVVRQQDNIAAFDVLKPLTTILILLLSLGSITGPNSRYTRLIVLALAFCLAGDILLLNDAYFVPGLIAFLLAHLLLVYAFSTVSGFSRNLLPLVVLLGCCIPYFMYLKPGLGNLLIPVAIYMLAIITMGWQAIALYLKYRGAIFRGIALAATLFIISDSLLAYDKFAHSFEWSGALILGTYWGAIYLLAYTATGVKTKQFLDQ